MDCCAARELMQVLVEHEEEIRLLQKTIRAVMVRAETREEVKKCDKDTVCQPSVEGILSPLEEVSEERLFITQTVVNRCLEAEFGVAATILKYFKQKDEREYVKKLRKSERIPSESLINRSSLYGYYQCDGKEAFAVV